MRSLVYATLLLIAGAAGGIVWSEYGSSAASAIASGEVLQSTDSDYVRMLSFSNAKYTFTAQRSISGGKFDLLFTPAATEVSVHCQLPSDLSRALQPFTHITARRTLSVKEREGQFPIHLGNLLVQTFSTEPDASIMVFTNHAGDAIAFIAEHYRAEVAVPISAFRRLDRGCKLLN